MGSRDRIPGVAEVNSVRPDRGGGLRCRHRPAPSVFAGARATSLAGWQALSLRRCCAGKQLTAMDVAYGRRTSVSPTHVNPGIKGNNTPLQGVGMHARPLLLLEPS